MAPNMNWTTVSFHNYCNSGYSISNKYHTFKAKQYSFRLDTARNHFNSSVVSLRNGFPEYNIVNIKSPSVQESLECRELHIGNQVWLKFVNVITNLFHTSYVFVYIADQVNANLSLTKNQVKYVCICNCKYWITSQSSNIPIRYTSFYIWIPQCHEYLFTLEYL